MVVFLVNMIRTKTRIRRKNSYVQDVKTGSDNQIHITFDSKYGDRLYVMLDMPAKESRLFYNTM
jgi:hypothetical protein